MELKEALVGIKVERGCLARCRDPSSFEMIMRSDKKFNGQYVKAILAKRDTLQGETIFMTNNDEIKDQIAAWLNPFYRREKKSKDDGSKRWGSSDEADS